MPSKQTQTITIKLASEQEVKRPVNSDEVKLVISRSNELDAKAFEKWMFIYFNIPDTETLTSFDVINESMLPPVVIRQWNVDTVPYTKEVLIHLAFRQLTDNLARVLRNLDGLNEGPDDAPFTYIESIIIDKFAYPEDLGDETEEEYGMRCIDQYIEDYPLAYIKTCLDNMEGWCASCEEDGDIEGAINTARLRFNELKEIATEMGWYDYLFNAHAF